MAYAILTHGIDPKERVFCPGGATFYGRFFRCHGRTDPWTSRRRSRSRATTYFYTMGKRLGIDAIAESAGLFGFGRPTGIDLAHEKSGIVPSPDWSLAVRKHPWYSGETISVAIGQGPVLVTGAPDRARHVRHRERGRSASDAAPLPHRRERAHGRALRLPARVEGVRSRTLPARTRRSSTASGAS